MDVERYRTMLLAVLSGATECQTVGLRWLTWEECKEFDALVREYQKESRPLRVHQVCGTNPLVVFYFQWCLAFSDRWPEKAKCYKEFYDYAQKNNYTPPFTLDKDYLAKLDLFYTVHDLVLQHRQSKAA